MGGCGSKTPEQWTAELWSIIEKGPDQSAAQYKVGTCIANGANIKQAKNGRTLYDTVIDAERRNRQASRTWQADNCNSVLAKLKSKASELIVDAVRLGNLGEVQLLSKLGADVHQSKVAAPFGLLGVAVGQCTTVNVDLVRFLVDSDPANRFAITLNDSQNISIHQLAINQRVSADVCGYLRWVFNMQLCQLPLVQPGGISVAAVPEVAIRWIVQLGADKEFADEKGNTVLCNAVVANNVDLVKRLVAAGCEINHLNGSRLTPLALAESASERNAVLIAFLRTESFNRQLHAAIRTSAATLTLDQLNEMLKAGATINSEGPGGNQALHLLVQYGANSELIESAINELHANIDSVNSAGLRPVDLAILHDESLLTLTVFLQHPTADLSTFYSKSQSKNLIQFAFENNRQAAVVLIQNILNYRLWKLCNETNPNSNNSQYQTGISEWIKLGAQMNHIHTDEDYNQYTPLHLLSKISNVKLVNFVITTHQADTSKLTGNNESVVYLAAKNGHLGIVQHYRTMGLNLHIVDINGNSALHEAALAQHLLVVRYLTLWGADHTRANAAGQIPLDYCMGFVPNTPAEESVNKQLIAFLKQLQFPSAEYKAEELPINPACNDENIEVCRYAQFPTVGEIKSVGAEDEDPLGSVSKGLLKGSPNSNLRTAAKKGELYDAKEAVANGADVRNIEDNRTVLEQARKSADDNTKKANSAASADRWKFRSAASNCSSVADYIIEVATTKITEAIKVNHPGRAVSFHRAGAKLGAELTYLAATHSDSVELMNYLLTNSTDCLKALYSYSTTLSPYAQALENKRYNVANYIFGRLSGLLTKAVSDNDLSQVRALVKAGGSVDSVGSNNLAQAISLGNLDLVKFLIEQGARMPAEWLSSIDPVRLPNMKPEIDFYLRYRVLDRKLRLSAAAGDYRTVIACQRAGADINSKNIHGATALSLCVGLASGSFLATVHALVSCGESMLHSNKNMPSLLQCCKSNLAIQPAYKSVLAYLEIELNVQFLAAVLDNDLYVAGALSALGADFNAITSDGSGQTAVHLAVRYHGVDLIKWLCERGSKLTIADANQNYPITQAADKGDFSSVEFMSTYNAATKQLQNSAGLTALDIAKRNRYNRMVQLLDPGNAEFPVAADEKDIAPPKYDLATLTRAAENGQLGVIEEFIAQRYASLTDKSNQCRLIIAAAERKHQEQVLAILKPHYKSLISETASDQTAERLVSASSDQKKILAGFLTSLSTLIGSGDVALDIENPDTYRQLFSNLNSQQQSRADTLKKINNDADLIKTVNNDSNELAAKMNKLSEEMAKMNQSKELLAKRLAATEAQLTVAKSATQKKDYYKEIQETKDQLLTLQSSVQLFVKASETANRKKKVIDSLKKSPNLLYFFTTIENRLQGLFVAVKSASAGIFKEEMTESGDQAKKVINLLGHAVEMIPIIGQVIDKVILGSVSLLVSHLDKSRQQQEYRNISTLGNVEQLNAEASNTAGLLTLYYQSQINNIDVSQKITIRSAENPVVTAAEYCIVNMIKALKTGSVVPGIELSQQLWLSVAARNPFSNNGRSMMDKAKEKMGLGAGKEKITLRNGVKVPLRNFYSCVSVVHSDGTIYELDINSLEGDDAKQNTGDMRVYGQVYLAAFCDNSTMNAIISKRRLLPVKNQSEKSLISPQLMDQISAFKSTSNDSIDLASPTAGAVAPVNNGTNGDSAAVNVSSSKLALTVADQLTERGLIVSSQQLKDSIQQSRTELLTEVESEVAILKEDIQQKANYYQTSIDAAAEDTVKQLTLARKEAEQYKKELQNANDRAAAAQKQLFAEYTDRQAAEAKQRLTELEQSMSEKQRQQLAEQKAQFDIIQKQLEASITALQSTLTATLTERTDSIKSQLLTTGEQMTAIAQKADNQSNTAISTANKAVDASVAASNSAAGSAASAKQFIENLQKYDSEMKTSISSTIEKTNLALTEQKNKYEAIIQQNITKTSEALEKVKEKAELASKSSSESSTAAKAAESAAKETAKQAKEQLVLLQNESKQQVTIIKDLQKSTEKSTEAAKEAEKQSKKASESAAAALAKCEKLEKQVEKKQNAGTAASPTATAS